MRLVPEDRSNGSVHSVLTFARDITEKQRASQSKMMGILESMTDAFVSLDRDWCYTYVNQRAGELFGRCPEDLIGKHIWSEFPEGVGQPFYHLYYQAIAEQRPMQIEEYYPPWERWFENRIYPSSEGISIFFQDITERKEAGLGLQRAKDELELKVQERTVGLQKLNQVLKTSNQELEQFSYTVAHDLQDPLRAITGYARLLKEDLGNHSDSDIQESIYFITDGAERMRLLIQDLLAYARVDDRQAATLIDCNEVVEEAIANLQLLLTPLHGIVTHDPLPTVQANKHQLRQLFQNLLSNAIKFHREEPPRIHIASIQESGEYRFSIQDNGIGIQPQSLDCIFEIFQRLHPRRDYPGTGIGLAICKKIVEKYGGRIWAESEQNIGTAFYFTIPHT
jgi:PAS domain S-box-containing protein